MATYRLTMASQTKEGEKETMKKPYFEGRKEKEITEGFGSYRLNVRYLANSNKAQVTMYDVAVFRFPLLWSSQMTDEQANAALDIFKAIGFFEMPVTV